MMKQIFGSNKLKNDANISSSSSTTTSSSSSSTTIKPTTNDEIHKLALESVKLIKRDRVVIETKKFAGQSIQ